MDQRLAPGALVAVYVSAVQWLVMGLFTGRSELLFSLVPLSVMTVIMAEGAILLRPYLARNGDPHVRAQSMTLWGFLLSLLAFATVSYVAGARSAGELDVSAWRWTEWAITLGVSLATLTAWSYVEAKRRVGDVA